MSKRSFLRIIRGKQIDSFWDMNPEQQREFVRELLSEFKPAIHQTGDATDDDATAGDETAGDETAGDATDEVVDTATDTATDKK